MADFAVTNARPAGTIKVYAADWSGTADAADGTITLYGGRVYAVLVSNQDDDVTKTGLIETNVSISSGTITVTIPMTQDVTNGRILIFYA